MTTTSDRRVPEAVVVDTADILTLDRDGDGAAFTAETAAAYCAMLNAERKPACQSWQVFRLLPADSAAAPAAGGSLDAGAFARAWSAAAAGTLSGDATMVLFEPDGTEPGTESWAVTSVTYEEDLAGAVVIRGRPVPGPDAMTSGPGEGAAPGHPGTL